MIKASVTFDEKGMAAIVQAAEEMTRNIIVTRLSEIGAQSVDKARKLPDQGGTYHHRSGRLKRSIGYMVTENGKPVAEDFLSDEGRQCALKEANGLQDGYNLIIVAGAEYAMNVHVRGYDVLDSALINAERQFKEFYDSISGS